MRSGRPAKGFAVLLAVALAGSAGIAQERAVDGKPFAKVLPNNFPHINATGLPATFSTRGFVDLTGEYFQAQGANGRSCSTCHIPQDAWSITPGTIRFLFVQTGGTHPIFNSLDAD